MQKTIAAAIDFIVFIAKTAASPSGRKVQELLHVVDHNGRDYITEPQE
jgi:type IV secretion system protein VirB11